MNIMNFGRHTGYVTWTTGLKERLAKKEIQMRQYRGLTKEGNWYYGNLIVNNARESDGIHKVEPLRTYIRERNLTWISNKDDKCWKYLTFEVIPETVEQFTGLKDKNGTEIYEDNLVTVYFGDLPSTLTAVARIVYSAQCQFVAEGIVKDIGKGPWSIDSKHIEVIGNIHQNPDLMEQDNG